MQIARDDSNAFGDDRENIFVHQLHKFNRSLEAMGAEMLSASKDKLRSDSFQPIDASGRTGTDALLSDSIDQSNLSLFTSTSRPLSIDPNVIKMGLMQTGLLSPVCSTDSLWSTQTSIPFPSATPVSNSISRYGQCTPPDDGPGETSTLNAQQILRKDSVRSSMHVGGTDDATSSRLSPASVQEDKSKSKPKSGQAPPRKRRRKSQKIENPEEDHKREEFLARNRVAASKSRQKKKEWTQALEHQLKKLQTENHHLSHVVNHLRDEIITMKTLCLAHVECDCNGIRDYMSQTLELFNGSGRRLSTLSASASSSKLSAMTNGDLIRHPGRLRGHSVSSFPSASQSPNADARPATYSMNSPSTSDSLRSRMNSSTSATTSSTNQLHQTLNMKIDSSTFSLPDAFESPHELDLSFGDGPDDSKDIDVSALWEETVGGGDFITGADVELQSSPPAQ